MIADVAVIGTGISGATVVAALRDAGASVLVFDAGGGTSASWSGIGDLFGPHAARRPASSNVDFGGLAPDAAQDNARPQTAQQRLDALLAERRDHPYARLGMRSAEAVAQAAVRAARLLGLEATLHADAATVATASGTSRRADLTAPGIARVDGRSGVFVGLSSWPSWDPAWAARDAAALGGAWRSLWVDDGAPSPSLLQSAAAWSRDPRGLVERIAAVAPGAEAVLPAVLGLTFDACEEATATAVAAGIGLGELAGGVDSLHGVRLRALLDAVVGETVAGDATATWSGDAWRIDAGGATHRAPKLVVATGPAARHNGASTWLDAFMPAALRPPRNTSDSPWLPQPFLLRGVATDGTLRITEAAGPAWASGAALGGHDFVHDGSAFGVATVTALHCAREVMAC